MVVLEARHVELFLHDEYRNGVWDYMDLGNHYAEVPPRASAAIFDLHHVDDPISQGNSLLSINLSNKCLKFLLLFLITP